MPRNRKRVIQKEKKIIEAYALSQNASCIETVACVIAFDFVGKKSDHSFKKCYVYDALYERGLWG